MNLYQMISKVFFLDALLRISEGLLTYEYVSGKLDEKLTVYSIVFDFEKACDKVNHYI